MLVCQLFNYLQRTLMVEVTTTLLFVIIIINRIIYSYEY